MKGSIHFSAMDLKNESGFLISKKNKNLSLVPRSRGKTQLHAVRRGNLVKVSSDTRP